MALKSELRDGFHVGGRPKRTSEASCAFSLRREAARFCRDEFGGAIFVTALFGIFVLLGSAAVAIDFSRFFEERAASTVSAANELSSSNLVVAFAEHIRKALYTCCSHCPVCYAAHESGGSRMRPCGRDHCLYTWEEHGYGTALSELRASQQVAGTTS